jgi:hypothetical protein
MERDRAALRSQHEIVRLCHSGLDSVTLRREVMAHVRRVVPTDAYCFTTADPATLMITGNVGEGLPDEAAPHFFEVEYSQEDFNKFAELARRNDPVADLAEATGGDLSRSARWREVFHPLGLDDDLRAAHYIARATAAPSRPRRRGSSRSWRRTWRRVCVSASCSTRPRPRSPSTVQR